MSTIQYHTFPRIVEKIFSGELYMNVKCKYNSLKKYIFICLKYMFKCLHKLCPKMKSCQVMM